MATFSSSSDIESETGSSSGLVGEKYDPTPDSLNFRRKLHSIFTLPDLRGPFKQKDVSQTTRRKTIRRRLLIFSGVTLVFGILAITIWYILLARLVSCLSPPPFPSNGLQQIIDDWTEPGLDGSNASAWREDFSRDIIPVSCHSHNDYWRRVPLYDSLAAGCTGVEADVWLKDHELYVAHDIDSIRPHRTFKSLYIDPITSILTHQNTPNKLTNGTGYRGAFDTSPNTTLSLLIDLKEDGTSAWPVVQEQLQPLRENGWLTHFNGASVVQRPVTVVVTGDASFDLVKQNTTYRDIFFDAPLDKLNDDYNSHNSYYASMSFKDIGQIWFNRLSSKQVAIIREHIKMASSRGLKSRYWDIPSWPVSLRMNIWRILQENDIGMLNVDDLITASRWNWEWCTVLGLTLC